MAIKIDQIENILGKNNDIIFFEVGANRGSDTQRFLDVFPNISLFCFEPDPRCLRKFRKYINDDRVVLVEAAVSDIDGEANLYLSGGSKKGHKSQHINSSSIKKPHNHLKKHPWCVFDENIKVKTITLDNWCNDNNINHIDWLWADVQGSEEELILGSLKNIK